MNNTSTRLLYLTFVLAIMFGTLPFSTFAQELPDSMTKEEFCEMLKNGQRPSMPQGTRPPEGFQPPAGGGFQGKERPNGMPPSGRGVRPEGFAPPNINCSDFEDAPVTPIPPQVQSAVKPTTTAPRIPAPSYASSTREKSKLDQLIEEDTQRNFYGSDPTFSNDVSNNVEQNAGFFRAITSKIASLVRNVLSWFQR